MRLETLTKTSLVFFFIVLSFLADWQTNLLLFAGFSLLGALQIFLQTEFISIRRAYSRFLLYAIAASALITVLNGFFLRDGDVAAEVLGITFYDAGLQFGITTGARLAVISVSLFLFFVTTPLRRLIQFFQQAGLPGQLTVILFLALHFIGQVPARISQIYTAQEARGAPVRGHAIARLKAFLAILFPLLLSSISETLERGAALEARGFRGELTAVSTTPFPLVSKVIATAVFLATLSLLAYSLLP
ncbi:MAG: energy-coupling factor transporter transmembrane protein EcfT [Ignavibacteriae bacterium]|nr:energy-coupling factor transporter transmembrane protein EcfT [Ignavibacteriota bacterium]